MPILTITGDSVPRRSLRRSRRSQKRKIRRQSVKLKPFKPIIPNGKKYRTYQLYALELEDGNYYVGLTSYKDVNRRIKEHVEATKRGAKWTKLHKPVSIIETRQIGYMSEQEACKLEDAMTIEYIDKYGIHCVRGGSMCFINVNKSRQRYLSMRPPMISVIIE